MALNYEGTTKRGECNACWLSSFRTVKCKVFTLPGPSSTGPPIELCLGLARRLTAPSPQLCSAMIAYDVEDMTD